MTLPSSIATRALCVAACIASGAMTRAAPAPTDGATIIRAMHDRYAKTWYRTLSFTQKTTLRTRADTMAVEQWHERALLPGRLRIDIERASGNLAVVYSGDSLFVWRGDSVLTRDATRNVLLVMGFDVYAQSPEATLAVLAGEHFPMSPVREDSWQGKAVYVIGAPAGDLRSPQLWIDKERMLFVRGIQPDERDSTTVLDFRFDNYVQVPGGWLSETVSAFANGKIVQREEYSEAKTNVAVDPQIFVPPTGR